MIRVWRYFISYKGKEMFVFSRLSKEEFEKAHLGIVIINYVGEVWF